MIQVYSIFTSIILMKACFQDKTKTLYMSEKNCFLVNSLIKEISELSLKPAQKLA